MIDHHARQLWFRLYRDVRPFGKSMEGYTFRDLSTGRADFRYTGEYYRKKLTDRELRVRKFFYCLFTLISLACFVYTGLSGIASTSSNLIALTCCISIVLFIWQIYALLVFLTRSQALTVWDFRVSALQFATASLVGGITMAVSALYTLVVSLTLDNGAFLPCFLTIIAFLLSAFLLGFLFILEINTEYEVIR